MRGITTLLSVTLLATAGCSLQPAVIATEPLWPFEQVQIRTSIGRVFGYLSRPTAIADRIIVVVNESPCPRELKDNASREFIGTSGIVWQQFKQDSLFFQFERPGNRSSARSNESMCGSSAGDEEANLRRVVADAVEALRRETKLDNIPTTYIGIGEHALIALDLATRDSRAQSVALIDASFGVSAPAQILNIRATRRSALRTIVVATETARGAQARDSQDLVALLRARGFAPSMLLVENVNPALGLADESECFQQVTEMLGAFVRSDLHGQEIHKLSCSTHEEIEPPLAEVEQVERI